jgi:hypothetical protein
LIEKEYLVIILFKMILPSLLLLSSTLPATSEPTAPNTTSHFHEYIEPALHSLFDSALYFEAGTIFGSATKNMLSRIPAFSNPDKELLCFLQRRWLAKMTGCYPTKSPRRNHLAHTVGNRRAFSID